MNSSHPSNPFTLCHDQILWLGIHAMATPGYHDIPMTAVIKKLISTPELNLTALLGDTFAAMAGVGGSDLRNILVAMDEHLDTLPHESSAALVHPIEIVFTVIATIFLALRFVGRKSITGKIRVDDWVMLAAWILTIAFLIMILHGTASAYTCHHIWDYTYNHWRKNFLATFICEILFSYTNTTIKLSWLLWYWTLAPIPWFRKSILAIGVFSVLTNLSALGMLVFACKRINFWDDPLNAKCSDRVSSFRIVVHGPISIVQDLLILLLPIPIIYNLRLATREKIIVIAMFAFGSFACYAGFIRVIYSKRFINDADMPYQESFAGLWATLELDFAIAISSVPAIRGLCRRYLRPKSFTQHTATPTPPVKASKEHSTELITIPAPSFSPFDQDANASNAHYLPSGPIPSRRCSAASGAFLEDATIISVTVVRTNDVSLVHSKSPSSPSNRRSSDWDRDVEGGDSSFYSSKSSTI